MPECLFQPVLLALSLRDGLRNLNAPVFQHAGAAQYPYRHDQSRILPEKHLIRRGQNEQGRGGLMKLKVRVVACLNPWKKE